jgi:rhamnose utilization protein RhaD (predicted bifunctional aldolase and dehydrogenase)
MERSCTKAFGVIPEFEQLRFYSSLYGADPLLVQAAGGNTSIKDHDVMWIKASGTWLKDALTKDIFVPLNLPALATALAADDHRCESCVDFVRKDLNTNQLRPSIETSVHGLMPQRVVVHVHCVSTIAWAIQENAEQKLTAPLKDFNWSWIPYARPGLQLSRAIRQKMKPRSDVLVLGNHGLVVAGASVTKCGALLRAVTTALKIEPREISHPSFDELQHLAGPDYQLPEESACHAAAFDPLASTIGTTSVFYPDHVVFLGTSLPSDPSSNAAALVLPGKGVLVRKGAKPSVEPLVRCLADVFRRVTQDAVLNPLTGSQVDALLNWEAETYRQNLKA